MSQSKSNRGAWCVTNPGKPSPYGVQWREKIWDEKTDKEITRTRSEFFADEAQRDKRLAAVLAQKDDGDLPSLTRAEIREWRAFMAAANGIPWQTIYGGYQAWRAKTGRKECTTTVAMLAETYLAHCRKLVNATPPELSADNLRHKVRVLRDFTPAFGHVVIDRLEAGEVEEWIEDFDFPSAATYNNVLKHLKAFLNTAVPKLMSVNPLAGCEKKRHAVDNRDKLITPQECAQLFQFALQSVVFRPLLARLPFEAFAGMRASSAMRLTRKDVHLAERAFVLPAANLKTGIEDGKSHYVDTTGLEGFDGMWELVESATASGWELGGLPYRNLRNELFRAAGVRHPSNTLRKSFATYDLAAHRNPGRTSFILGHQDQVKLWNDYKGNATTATARLYQAIALQTVREIAEGEMTQAPNPPRKGPAPPGGS